MKFHVSQMNCLFQKEQMHQFGEVHQKALKLSLWLIHGELDQHPSKI